MARSPSKKLPTPAETRLLTIRAAAAYLSASVWFVRTLQWERRVPFVKFGNRILFDRADLDAFIAAQKNPAA